MTTRLQDIEQLGGLLQGWDFDFRQLDSGTPDIPIRFRPAQRGAALRIRLNRGVHQLGATPPGLLAFGVPDQPIEWHGVARKPGDLIDFNHASGFEGLSSAGFSGHVVVLPRPVVESVAADLGVELPAIHAGQITAGTPGVRQLREALRHACTPGTADAANSSLNYDAAAAVVRALTRGSAPPTGERPQRRAAVRAALELLEQPAGEPTSVAQICQSVGVSAPTLYRAFQEAFGVSPKRYLLARSLAGVRKDIQRAEPGTSVADHANRWGFWHLGRFAAHYQAKYGELPSQTATRTQ